MPGSAAGSRILAGGRRFRKTQRGGGGPQVGGEGLKRGEGRAHEDGQDHAGEGEATGEDGEAHAEGLRRKIPCRKAENDGRHAGEEIDAAGDEPGEAGCRGGRTPKARGRNRCPAGSPGTRQQTRIHSVETSSGPMPPLPAGVLNPGGEKAPRERGNPSRTRSQTSQVKRIRQSIAAAPRRGRRRDRATRSGRKSLRARRKARHEVEKGHAEERQRAISRAAHAGIVIRGGERTASRQRGR
jgi:hypothetical protein